MSRFQQFGRRQIKLHILQSLHEILMFLHETAHSSELKKSHLRDHSLLLGNSDKYIGRDHAHVGMSQSA